MTGRLAVILSVLGAIAGTATGQVNPQSFILLVDTSASMKQSPANMNSSKAAEVKRQLGEFGAHLPLNTGVRIFTFDKAPPIAGPDLLVTDDGDRQTLRSFFRDMQTEGEFTYAWSSLEHVLGEARAMLEREPRRTVWVYAYTDGEDNEQPPRDLNAILDEYSDLLKNRDRIRVDYITLGFELRKDWADALARHGIGVKSALRPEDYMDLGPLQADFDWSPWQITSASPVSFDDLSIGNVQSHMWEFGDGGTSREARPIHEFSSAGTYDVTLTVTTSSGRTSTRTRNLVVEPAMDFGPPTPRFEVNKRRGEAPLTVHFTNVSTGSVQRYIWDFGDGSPPLRQDSLQEFDHQFQEAGEYTITLIAEGPLGLARERFTPDWPIVVVESVPWNTYIIWALVAMVLLFIALELHRHRKRRQAR